MDLDKLKQANQIYESLAEKTIDEALNQLNTYDHLDIEVLNLVKSLIHNSHQPSIYFEQKVSQHYQTPLSQTWQKGDQIGGYELLALIGQGGMSLVFKAMRVNSETQKPVAIKLFNLAHQSPELKARFQAEQSMLAELSHPNVIEFHHGENTDQGESFIVMELIDGGLPIDEYVSKHALNTKQIVALVIQATEALQYAHNHLIIHRDIKPSNIMIDGNGHLKVLDFGIAKLINPKNEGLTESQAKNTLMALTPSFASPEQIKAERIDVTSDVYSLAAVLVYLLTDQLPFPSNRMLNACVDDEHHVRKLLKTEVQDQDLRHILMQALQPDRNARYSNMFAFNEDLNAWLAQKPVSASKDSWWYRLNRFAVRRTALFSTSLLLCATIVIAVIALSIQNQSIKLEADKANAVKQFMLDSFSVTDPNVSQGVDLSTKDLLRSAANKIMIDDGMDPAIKLELYVALALANGRLGYYPEAIDLLNDALIIQPQNEQATALLAQYLFSAGEIKTVNELLTQTQEDNFDTKSQAAAVKRVRANVLAQAGDYESALIHFDALGPLTTSDIDTIKNQSLLAEIHYLKGESVRSVEIIQSLKRAFPLPATDVLNLKLNSDLVQYYDRVGNFSAAMALTQENIQAYRKILGEDHPDLGIAYNALSAFQWLDGQLDEALISAETSKEIFRKRYGDSSEGLSQAHGNAGAVYYYQEKYELAIDELAQAAGILQGIFGPDHPETMNAKANLATILNATGNPEKALPILQHMYKVESKTLGKNHRSTLYTQQSLALTLAKMGQYDQATAHAKTCVELIKENFTKELNFINHAHSVLGRVYFMAGNHQLAIEQNLIHINGWTEGDENNFARSLQLIAASNQALQQFVQAAEFYKKWTNHLAKTYGETDVKYLQGMLQWAEQSQSMNQRDQAHQLLSLVAHTLKENDLNFPEIQSKLLELSR
ncbi:serine/threonine-protein kinase [Marinicella litoralis]|uniref:Serine/threonine protein kinase n=1 Tax=Marinicella litoralis TaxID=644220 RepID=A0A4R6XS12_9GAMM|nr:serine/threonine-protein kinase [Marinicella litoralis]TDR22712.1 serine/threonine protein kinase [Marinicella litoralis]